MDQESSRIAQDRKVHYCVHDSAPPYIETDESKSTPYHCFFKIPLIFSSQLFLCLPRSLFTSDSPTKTLYALSFTPQLAHAPLISSPSVQPSIRNKIHTALHQAVASSFPIAPPTYTQMSSTVLVRCSYPTASKWRTSVCSLRFRKRFIEITVRHFQIPVSVHHSVNQNSESNMRPL